MSEYDGMRVLGWLSTQGVRIFRENPDTADKAKKAFGLLIGVALTIEIVWSRLVLWRWSED